MLYEFNSIFNLNFDSNAHFFLISRRSSVGVKSRYFSFRKGDDRHVYFYSTVVASKNQTDCFIFSYSNFNANSNSLVVSNKSDITPNIIDKRPNFSAKFVTRLLDSFNDPNNILINDEKSQRTIENIILEEFESVFSGNTNKYIAGGVNTELLNPILSKYILEKKSIKKIYR